MKQQENLESLILKHGLDRDLHSMAAIARYLNYDENSFRVRVRKMTLRHSELKRIFTILKFKPEEIIEVMA
jgi:hypothetical protein